MGTLGKAATVGVGAAGIGAATLPDEDLPEEFTSDEGQQQYLSNRALFEDEWADWLVDMGKAADKTEALEMVRGNPMFSEGGRVKANTGLFAGQMGGMNPGMNQMRNPNMNPMGQGLGAPNLGPRSMGMTPGMTPGGGQMDPRMAQLMQGRGRPSRPVPKESEDTELIQLIKMLTSLGIPMEQLRGRTKEELVEMLVSVKGKTGGQEIPEVEEEVVEEEVVQAAHGGRIGLTGGQLVKKESGPGRQGYQGDKPPGVTGQETGGGYSDRERGQQQAADRRTRDLGPGWQSQVKLPPPKVETKDDRSWFKRNIYDNTNYNINARQKWLAKNMGKFDIDELVRRGLIDVHDEDLPAGSFGKGMPAVGYTGTQKLGTQASLDYLRDFGYTGGMPTPGTGGGGGGGQTYSTAGAGTGITTAGTTGDDYYKFAEWDKWLMPGETATQPLMPGGYKPEILANTGGLMRTGYAMGTEHPVVPSKDGKQLDMRDTGGYQPHGKAEKHDDVRALLAQGEFVMTSDAVKGMGGGDREVGAKKMYNLMHNMEAMA